MHLKRIPQGSAPCAVCQDQAFIELNLVGISITLCEEDYGNLKDLMKVDGEIESRSLNPTTLENALRPTGKAILKKPDPLNMMHRSYYVKMDAQGSYCWHHHETHNSVSYVSDEDRKRTDWIPFYEVVDMEEQ